MNNPPSKLNSRERRLALLTLVLSLSAICVLIGMRGYSHLASLNGDIDRLEQELLNLTQQNAQRGVIEVAYGPTRPVFDHLADGEIIEKASNVHTPYVLELHRVLQGREKGLDGSCRIARVEQRVSHDGSVDEALQVP